MKSFIAITQCIGKVKNGHKFHFIGVYSGLSIKEIIVFSKVNFKKNEEYILHLEVEKWEENSLYTRLLKFKNLSEVRY